MYVVGLSMAVCVEEKLRRPEYFGKYGKIVKVSRRQRHFLLVCPFVHSQAVALSAFCRPHWAGERQPKRRLPR